MLYWLMGLCSLRVLSMMRISASAFEGSLPEKEIS